MTTQHPLALLCLALSACETFTIPDNANQIGETDLYLVGGERAQLPTPTSSGTAPKITGITATQTGTFTYNLYFDVEGPADIAWIYLDFAADGVYRARAAAAVLAGGDTPPTACGVAASSQGITCTPACLSACACLSCSDKQIELNAEQACALNCTTYVNSGAINSAPYNGSEKNVANVVYNGLPEYGLTGIASQQPGCSASKCQPASTTGARTKGWSISFTAPTVPAVTQLSASMVETAPSGGSPEVSAPFARASVSTCKQGDALPCRY